MAALGYLATHPHRSATEIHRGVAPELPTLTLQSVHNIVQDLAERGILRRIHPPASNAALYEVADEHAHPHAQCVRCGRLVDLPDAPAPAAGTTPMQSAPGMTIIGVVVTYLGVCAECATP